MAKTSSARIRQGAMESAVREVSEERSGWVVARGLFLVFLPGTSIREIKH